MSATYPTGVRWDCDKDPGKINTARHFEGTNLLFLDGHVKWLKSVAQSSGPSAPPRDGLAYDGDGTVGGPGVTTSNINTGNGGVFTATGGWD